VTASPPHLLPNKYYLMPQPLRALWLQHRLADLLAKYRSRTAYVRAARLLEENHHAAGLPRPSPLEREQLILDALELAEVRDALGRTWRLQGRYVAGGRSRSKVTYLVYTRDEGAP